MRKIFILFIFFYAKIVLATTLIDIEFKSINGDVYHTISLLKDLEKHYGFKPYNPKVLLIETSKCDNAAFIKQHKALNNIGHQNEEFQILFVSACLNERYKHGYSTSVKTSNQLNTEKIKFRIRLLNSSGTMINESIKPISSNMLVNWMNKMNLR